MAINVVVKDQIDGGIAAKLNAIGQGGNNGAAGVNNLNRSLRNSSASAFSGAMTNATSRMRAMQTQSKSLAVSMGNLNTSLTAAGRGFRGFISGVLLLGAFAGVLSGIDAYQNLENQLRQTTNSQGELNAVMSEMFDIAQRTRVPVGDLGKLYRRIDNAMEHMGRGAGDSKVITESIAGLLKLSGATSQEAASGMLQLSQAFNKGKLDGDEFRTVAELMPGVIIAITESIGISIAEVFKWSKEGKISAKVMADALIKESEKIKARLAATPKTIGDYWTNVKNEIIEQFGQLDNEIQLTDSIGRFLKGIQDNLPQVTAGLLTLGAAMATISFAGLAAGVAQFFGALTAGGLIAVTLSGLAAILLGIGIASELMGNKLMVAGSDTVQLRDYLKALRIEMGNLLSDFGGDFLGSIFKADSAQAALDVVTNKLKSMSNTMDSMLGSNKEIGGTQQWINEMFAAILVIQEEGFGFTAANDQLTKFFADATNLGIDFVASIVDKLSEGLLKALRFVSTELGRFPGSGRVFDFEGYAKGIDKQLEGGAATKIGDSIRAKKLNVDPVIGTTTLELLDKIDEKTKELNEITKQQIALEGTLGEKVWDRAEAISKVRREQEAIKAAGEYMNLFQLLERGADPAKAAEVQRQIDLMNQDTKALNREHDKMVEKLTEAAQGWQNILGTVENVAASLKGVNAGAFRELTDLTKQRGDAAITTRTGAGGFTTENSPFTEKFIQQSEIFDAAFGGGAGSGAANFQQEVASAEQASETIKQTFTEAASAVSASLNSIDSSGFAAIGTAATTVAQSIQTAFSAVVEIVKNIGIGFTNIATAASSSSSTIKSISAAANEASQGVSTMTISILANLNEIILKAQEAAIAVASIGGGGGGGGAGAAGGGGNGLSAFANESNARALSQAAEAYSNLPELASGGYTGNIGRQNIAGLVHGQEYVMPASATAKYRPLLDAMRAGTATTSGTASSGGVNVSVQNYGSSKISVQQLSPNDIRIIAREESVKAAINDAPRAIASQLNNPNSVISKSLSSNINSKRRR